MFVETDHDVHGHLVYKVNCITCGILMWQQADSYNKSRKSCCSIKCRGRYNKGRQCGKNHHNWKGGEEVSSLRKRYYENIRKKNYPEKYLATGKVSWAVASGKLYPQPCSVCGTCNNPQAHHEDYSKPLEVIWLCSKCHVKLHKEKHHHKTTS